MFGTARPFVVGDLSKGKRPVRQLEDISQLNTIQDGERMTKWGWLSEWGDGCVRPEELERLRHIGDDKSDAVVRFLGLRPGQDGLKSLNEYMASTSEAEWDDCIRVFWEEVARDPPQNVSALQPSRAYTRARQLQQEQKHAFENGKVHLEQEGGFEKAQMNGNSDGSVDDPRDKVYTPDAAIFEQNRHPLPILSQGQAVFWRFSGDMFHSLLHFSLAGGFASARIMATLRETGYLTSTSRDATYRRLMETTQALVDFMGDMTPITGKGWQSAIRVRMLHSQVRIRILDGKSKFNDYSVEKDGIPVNQEDLLGTLGGFCMAPLWCQKRLGVHLTMQEEQAFIAAWRHIGYYLGIQPSSLARFFGTDDPTTTGPAHRFFACIAFHLFDARTPPKDPFSTATYKILHAVAHRPPGDKTTLFHCELSRMLLGKGLADQLAIPRGSWKEWAQCQQHGMNSWVTYQFSRFYTKRWNVQRQLLFRRIIILIVAWQLGEKRSHFAWKEEKDHEKKISELDSKEAGEEAGLEFGLHIGRQVRSQARWLFGEMGVVLAGLGVTSAVLAWQMGKYVFAFVR